MTSPEFQAFQARLASTPPAPPPANIQELRERIDESMSRLPLADGTDAEPVDANGVPAIWCTRRDASASDDPVLVYFHGGGYRIGSAIAYRAYGSHLAAACRARVLLVDYRLAPENPFPAAVDDAIRAYEFVLGAHGVPPSRVVVGGDSAGGGLTAALLVAVRERGLPLPAGAVCLSPWVDLTNTSATFTSRSDSDKMFSKIAADEAARLYLGEGDRHDPLASPLFADWTGMPPVHIQVGDTEVLLDDAENLAKAARDAGVDVEHHVYDGMPHVWQLNYPAYPEAVDSFEKICAFIARVKD
jgi:acetyl esterase/lipase